MKVALINPAQTFFKGSQDFSVSLPVGLLSIAAVLRDNGFSVTILDALISDFKVKKLSNSRIQYGMSWQNLEEKLSSLSPDLIGVTIPFTAQEENGIKTIQIAKKSCPNAKVVAGGPHISVRFREVLSAVNECDMAVRGEGEETFLELAQCIKENSLDKLGGIRGLSFRIDEQCIHNPERPWINDLDSLPFPAYDLVDMERYLDANNRFLYANRFGKQRREISFFTSRGCPFSCVFCSINLHMGRKWRAYSVDYIIQHLQKLVNAYGVKHIHFEDDNLTLDKKRFNSILDGIIENNFNITWDTPNGVRADTLDINILRKAKRSGLQLLTIGVESGVQRVLDKVIRKSLSLDRVVKAAEDCFKLRIPLRAFFVIGFPGETIDDMKGSLRFGLYLKKVFHVDWNFLVATPLFGTRLYKNCIENNYLIKPLTPASISQATMEHGDSLIKTDDFSPEDIRKIIRMRRISFFRIRLLWFVKNPLKYIRRLL